MREVRQDRRQNAQDRGFASFGMEDQAHATEINLIRLTGRGIRHTHGPFGPADAESPRA